MTPGDLPPHLAGRVLALGGLAEPAGEFVVYWMRTAVRAHENPALDVALGAAARLGLPVFVYHALSERYPYASDRHHRFILEGATDVSAELAARGIGYAFHLERPGHRGPHLRTLAARAALVVTEDMPVRPLVDWTAAVARHRAVWAVDTACLAPMRAVPRSATTRAFRFRTASDPFRQRWRHEPWPDAEPGSAPFLPDLPFEPVALPSPAGAGGGRAEGAAGAGPASDGHAFLADLVAQCAIDHSVGPVPHTPGGSVAGYARWASFRDGALRHYARDRNDPLRQGVSRMSPYLHYGHVSPFRLAREARAVGGRGAEKYLDELLVWRELAHAFCAAHPEHDTVEGLPGWARDTLRAHEGDDREPLTWERLARGRTGDALWDAAQQSLRIHGELHNNLRMTWGKAFLGWTRTAEEALSRMEDLNHRYALDGRDPASYGGLLWCLGQFDRPFSPERPVFGTVRSRSTDRHAERLDLPAYRRRTARPAWERAPRVAVVGAGLAGLMAGRTLQDHGLDVTVFDKGRRPGGRSNTREHDAHRFDHGAQYFTARDPMVQRLVASWEQAGVVAPWQGRLVRIEGRATEAARAATRWVGTPGMIAVAQHLAADLTVRSATRIVGLSRGAEGTVSGAGGRWFLASEEGGEYGPFDRVVVAVPAPQAAELLAPSPELAAAARAVDMAPVWAGLFAFEQRLPLDFDGAFLVDGPLSWIARDSSKPGRAGGERWVVHATSEWTQAHHDTPRERIPALLMTALQERFGSLPDPVFQRAHRWGYARADDAGPDGPLYDPAQGVVVCGDWCEGGRVEGALVSGAAAAGRLLGEARVRPGGGPVRTAARQTELALD
ncbi:MAG: FAD-dependent oxidoreductase [Longimicrobiales bacterium]